MKLFISISFLFILLFSVDALSQKKSPSPRPKQPANPGYNKLKGAGKVRLPEIKDFAFVIRIDRSGNSHLTVQKSEQLGDLSSSELKDFFDKFLILQNTKKPSAQYSYLDPVAIICPEPSLRMNIVINVINSARKSYPSRVKVLFDSDKFLYIPGIIPESQFVDVIPNPLTLVVKLDKESKLTLNNISFGDLSNTSILENKLREIFKARADNGVFRENANVTETTVFLKVPLSASFADVANIAKTISSAGSDLIGLQVDDLEQ